MKKSVFISSVALFVLIFMNAFPQDGKNEVNSAESFKLYIGTGGGFCIEGGIFGIHGTYVNPKNKGISLSIKTHWQDSKNVPYGYHEGFLVFGDGAPDDILNLYTISYVCEQPSDSRLVRIGIELGPSLAEYREAVFTPNLYSGGWGSSHTVNYDLKYSVGLSVRPKITFDLGTWIGFEIAPYFNLNKYQTTAGFELCMNLGKLRMKNNK